MDYKLQLLAAILPHVGTACLKAKPDLEKPGLRGGDRCPAASFQHLVSVTPEANPMLDLSTEDVNAWSSS